MFQEEAKNIIENHFGPISIYKPKLSQQGAFGLFQLNIAEDRPWIHADPPCYIGLVYLNPDPPPDSGTVLYRHKDTGHYYSHPGSEILYEQHAKDYTKWDVVDNIGNKYNRCVIYKANMFHGPKNYFGNNDQNGRLYQLFFFDINSDK